MESDQKSLAVELLHPLMEILPAAQPQEKCVSTPDLLEEMKVELAADMVDGITPRLNELLMVVWGSLSLVSMDIRNGKDPTSSLDEAQDACGKIRDFLHQLNQLSPRISDEQLQPINAQEFAINFANSVELNPKTSMVVDCVPEVPPIAADDFLLRRALGAVVKNAEESMPGGGTIRLRVERLDSTKAVVSIEDTGVGIAPKFLPKVFEPFFTTKKRGRGLGLAGVMAAVVKMKGEVNISSKMGKGTRVRIILPLSQPRSADMVQN